MRFEREECYLDTKTNIRWSKGNTGPMTWYEAVDKAPKGWCLPTSTELLTILDPKLSNPVTELPDMHPLVYWTLSVESLYWSPYHEKAWYIDFGSGKGSWGDKSCSACVRYIKDIMQC